MGFTPDDVEIGPQAVGESPDRLGLQRANTTKYLLLSARDC